jgi:hypothetical protein
MDEARIEDIPPSVHGGNDFLIVPYTEVEIQKAVFLMEHNEAP